MGNPTITRFPNGVNNVAENAAMGDLPFLDPALYITYFDDFFTYTAGDWTLTETQVGATQALAAGNGGLLLLTNTAADDDLVLLQQTVATYTPEATKNMFVRARFKVSDATQSDLMVGLATVDTTPFASLPTAGFYFLKSDGSASLIASARAAGASTSITLGTMANDTFVDVALVYQPALGLIQGFLNGNLVASTDTLTNLPLTAITPTIALQNGEAVAKTMTIDYIMTALQR